MTVMIGEMNWREYHEHVKDGKTTVFLPLGALEQHGPHMSMNVDVLLPTAMARTVAEKVGGLVAPTLTYGYKSQVRSGGGNHMPGTTSLDGHTVSCTVRDIISEFGRHGVRRLVIVNGHFENAMFMAEGADLALRALRADGIRNMRVMTTSYWDFIGDDTIARLYPNDTFPGWTVEHGGVQETSMMLYWHPEFVDMNAVIDHPPAVFPPYDVFPPDVVLPAGAGTLSSPKHATREKGEIIVSVCRDKIGEAVQEVFGR